MALTQLEILKNAFRKYGNHLKRCKSKLIGRCDCGYVEVVKTCLPN